MTREESVYTLEYMPCVRERIIAAKGAQA